MSSKKKGAPLPASSAGLLRFFEDETKGFKVDPKIVVSVPISLIVVSWLMDIFIYSDPLMDKSYSDVSNIHKRFSLTLLNPSSIFFSHRIISNCSNHHSHNSFWIFR